MKFTKMQGCGNDYVYINGLAEKVEQPGELSMWVSDRRTGIGADGLILILPSERGDFTMHMYNADGSQGEMCGNAIRCVGKYVYEHGMTTKEHLVIDTLAGEKYLDLKVEDGIVTEVTVDMGCPILHPDDIPILLKGDQILDYPIMVAGELYRITGVSVGNPHVIVFVEETASLNLEQIGPRFENHPLFPNRINTEFVEVISDREVRMRVWERGSGETHACGTGATACAYACMLHGHTKKEVVVHMLGGDLKIRYDSESNHLFMTGPAVTVFEGELLMKGR